METASALPYVYQPLRSETAIRLLKLHPYLPATNGCDDVLCDLDEYSLESASAVGYRAVSYA